MRALVFLTQLARGNPLDDLKTKRLNCNIYADHRFIDDGGYIWDTYVDFGDLGATNDAMAEKCQLECAKADEDACRYWVLEGDDGTCKFVTYQSDTYGQYNGKQSDRRPSPATAVQLPRMGQVLAKPRTLHTKTMTNAWMFLASHPLPANCPLEIVVSGPVPPLCAPMRKSQSKQ